MLIVRLSRLIGFALVALPCFGATLAHGQSDTPSPAASPHARLEARLADEETRRAAGQVYTMDPSLFEALNAVDADVVSASDLSRVATLLWFSENRLDALQMFNAALGKAAATDDVLTLERTTSTALDLSLLDRRFDFVVAVAPTLLARLETLHASRLSISRTLWQYAEGLRESGDREAARVNYRRSVALIYDPQPEEWSQRVAGSVEIAMLDEPRQAVADLLALDGGIRSADIPDAAKRGLRARIYEALGRLLMSEGRMEDADRAYRRAATIRGSLPSFADAYDARSALNSLAMIDVVASDLSRSPNFSIPPVVTRARAFVEASDGRSVNYRTRAFTSALLDLAAVSATLKNFGLSETGLFDPATFRQLTTAVSLPDDPDPVLRLHYLKAVAYSHPENLSLDILTSATDQWIAAGHPFDAEAVTLANDATAVSLAAGLRSPNEGSLANLSITLSKQGLDLLAERSAQSRSRSATGLGGVSWMLYQARGGRGDPLSIAFPLRLEALAAAREAPWRSRAVADEQAFEALSLATERNLSSTVASIVERRAAGAGRLGDLVRHRQAVEQAQSNAEKAALEFDASSQQTDVLARLAADHRRTTADISTLAPDFETGRTESRPTLADTQALLDPDEAVLVIYGGDDLPPQMLSQLPRPGPDVPRAPGQSVTIALVTSDGFDWRIADLTAAELSIAVRSLRCTLDTAACATPQVSPGVFDGAQAYGLFRSLVAPLLPALGDRRKLFVVAPGAMASLPIDVLWTSPPSGSADLRSAPWLIRHYTTARLPSLAALPVVVALRQEARAGAGFVGFGAPIVTGLPQGAPRLVPLAYSASELQAVGSLFDPTRRTLNLAAAATETAVATTTFSDLEVLVFSTHGLPAGSWPGVSEPGLVLSPEAATSLNDGFLSSTEVADLRIDADWVILSACRTASSDGSSTGDSFTGLARAFLYAGAKAVVVSHWDVRDDVAATVVANAVETYRADATLGHAGALRKATLDLIDDRDDPTRSHPSVWAAFSVIGDAF